MSTPPIGDRPLTRIGRSVPPLQTVSEVRISRMIVLALASCSFGNLSCACPAIPTFNFVTSINDCYWDPTTTTTPGILLLRQLRRFDDLSHGFHRLDDWYEVIGASALRGLLLGAPEFL